MSETKINIYGPTQVLPNATKAEQNFYGDKVAEMALRYKDKPATMEDLSPAECQLYTYLLDVNKVKGYSHVMAECTDTKALARIIHSMKDEPGIGKDLIVKAEFLEVAIVLAPKLAGSKDVAALRAQVNNIIYNS